MAGPALKQTENKTLHLPVTENRKDNQSPSSNNTPTSNAEQKAPSLEEAKAVENA
jgi:hypothetical protein